MSAVSPIWIVGAGALLVLATSKPRKRRRSVPQLGAGRSRRGAANAAPSSSGLRIDDEGKLKIVSWDEWMRKGPAMIHVSLQEGTETPEQVTANVLRRLFPEYSWPPEPGDLRFATWQSMNALVGRALDQPIRPYFEVVS